MRLLLLRHGHAEAWASADHERQLTEKGRQQLRSVLEQSRGRPIAGQGLVSPYLRARQSVTEFVSFYPQLSFEETPLLSPDTPVSELLPLLQRQQPGQDLILVGHNPLLSSLLALLLASERDSLRHMGTANMACLQTDVVEPSSAELEYFLEP